MPEPAPDPKLEPRLAAIRAATARPLTDEDWALVRTRLQRSMAMADAVRAVPLDNGDGPAGGFTPFRASEQG